MTNAQPQQDTQSPRWAGLATGLAVALPAMVGLALPPSPTLAHQCLAYLLWGALVAALAPGWPGRNAWPLLATFALLAAAALGSTLLGAWPTSLAVLALAALATAALVMAAGNAASRRAQAVPLFTALAWGLLCAGLFNSAVALIQVWLPQWADGLWIASSDLPGRAIGNFRHSNHLSLLLLWSLAAAAALHALRRLSAPALWVAVGLLVLALELSASRLGVAGLLLLAAWAATDRRLAPGARHVLLSLPLLYGVCWVGMALLADTQQLAVGAGGRIDITSADSPNTRWNIWRTAWALVAAHPWSGVGFGEFNLAWTLTAFDNRPIAFFDHSHNLPLHLAVELGLPLAGLVIVLLAIALWRTWQVARRADGDLATVVRAALVMLLLVGGHSMVEYPLWFSYVLLPTAWVWGLLLGVRPADDGPTAVPHRPGPQWLGLLGGLLVSLGAIAAWLDYRHIVDIYMPGAPGQPLAARIEAGQHSLFFAHMADHAAAVNPVGLRSRQLGLARAPHALTDPALMISWAQYLAAAGDLDRARWLAQRLKDFRHPAADRFFAVCAQPGAGAFQCAPPSRPHDWREFLSLPRIGTASPAAGGG